MDRVHLTVFDFDCSLLIVRVDVDELAEVFSNVVTEVWREFRRLETGVDAAEDIEDARVGERREVGIFIFKV